MSLGAVKTSSPQKRLLNISAFQTSSNQSGVPWPYISGRARVAVTWVSPEYNVTVKNISSSGGGKGSSKAGNSGPPQLKYFGDLCGFVCVCSDDQPVDQLELVLANGEIVFQGPLWRTPGQHYAAFSLQQYCQDCRIWWGTKDSPFDDHILGARTTPIGAGDPRNKATYPIDTSSGGAVLGGQFVAGVTDPQTGHYDTHPAYRNVCRLTFKQFHLGSTKTMPNIEVIVRRGAKYFFGTIATADQGINPAGPAYEILTDDLFGAGLPDSKLDLTSFNTVKDNCDAAGIAIAPLVNQATSLRTFIADYVQYYNGWFRTKAGILQAGMFRTGNFDTSGVPILGDDDLTSEPVLNPGSIDDTFNFFPLLFTNKDNYFYQDDVSARYSDDANFEKVGERRVQEVQRPFIIDATYGIQYITGYGIIASQEQQTGSLLFRREKVKTVLPGDLIKLNSGSYSQTLLLRVLNKKNAASNKGITTLQVQREPGTWPALFNQAGIPKPGEFILSTAPIDYYLIFELPALLSDVTDNTTEIVILALRPNEITIGFNVHLSTDSGATYDKIATLNHFAVLGLLTSDYLASSPNPDTSVGMHVDLYGYDLDTIAAMSDQQRDDDTILAIFQSGEIESVGNVTALGSGHFNIFGARGRFNTVIADHLSGERVWFVFRSDLERIANKNFTPGSAVDFKLQSFTDLQDYDVSLAAAIPYTFGSPPTYGPPSLSPGTGTYDADQNVAISLDSSLTARYRTDGIDVTPQSLEWPKSGGVYTTLPVLYPTNTILKARGYAPDGTPTDQAEAVYTFVTPGGGGGGGGGGGAPPPACATVLWSFSGTQHHTGGNLTLTDSTPASTIHISTDSGATWSTYTAPFHVGINGDVLFYASAAGYSNSPVGEFNNEILG